MKEIYMLLLFIGILFIIIDLVKASSKCPEQKIIYKYIPRTFDEEQEQPGLVTDIFKSMFTQPSPWIANVNDVDTRKNEVFNKYFISQI
jgi:hypothetical protein